MCAHLFIIEIFWNLCFFFSLNICSGLFRFFFYPITRLKPLSHFLTRKKWCFPLYHPVKDRLARIYVYIYIALFFAYLNSHKKIGTPSPTFLKYNHRKRSFWMDSTWFCIAEQRGHSSRVFVIVILCYKITTNGRLLFFCDYYSILQ